MSERINMKCPSCNGSFIFIGEGGYLTCSYVDCPEPDIAKKVAQLEARNKTQEDTILAWENDSAVLPEDKSITEHVTQLEADRDEYRNLYHMGEAKITSREAIIEQLSESELAKDVTRLEAEHKMLRGFWDGLTERMFDGYSIDEFMVSELGVEAGLLTEEIYEPEGKHKDMNMGEAEPGELCYVNNLFKDE